VKQLFPLLDGEEYLSHEAAEEWKMQDIQV